MKLTTAFFLGFGTLALTACEDVTTTTTTTSYDRHVTIVNDTNVAMVRFYGSNAGASTWEEDILGQDVLPAHSSVRVNFDDGSGYCTFDFKAVFRDGSSLIDSNVDVCQTGTVTFR
ncbi:hypothetical protein GC209_09510 [bacterium]|nr:hypothetical protein [bacterium]